MKKRNVVATTLIVVALLFIAVDLGVYTKFREYAFKKDNITEETSYKNRKGAEDSARALLTQYEFNKGEYEQYKEYIGSDDKARSQRGMDALTAVNMVVSKYNNYLTQNQFVFKGNLPNDIPYQLEFIK